MKKFTLFIAAILFAGSMSAMSVSRSREEARFLTDKMAYELRLTPSQIRDVYEINYDYFRSLDDIYTDYSYEDRRREAELRYVLSRRQWNRYIDITYFYRPVTVVSGVWTFHVRTHYPRVHYYYAEPHGYRTYVGGRRYNRHVPVRPHVVPDRPRVIPGHRGDIHRPGHEVERRDRHDNRRDFDRRDNRRDRDADRRDNRDHRPDHHGRR
ncbi:MAG: hypothetical protein IKR18_09130 [Bacteroidaceae bacterium]|nr:hypothetical protein [Bacteroidaceae bacterium]